MSWQDPLRVVTTEFLHSGCQQSWASMYWLDRAIREFGVRSVVECGTGSGMLTAFLALHVEPDQCLTVDINDYRDDRTKAIFARLCIATVRGDLYAADTRTQVEARMNTLARPLLLLCDGGANRKNDDFALYTPPLRADDIVAVHDCGTEFDDRRQDVLDIVTQRGMVRWHEDEMLFDSALLAVWHVTR